MTEYKLNQNLLIKIRFCDAETNTDPFEQMKIRLYVDDEKEDCTDDDEKDEKYKKRFCLQEKIA